MTLTLTPEQDELAHAVRQFCVAKAPIAAVRRWSESLTGMDEAVWDQMVGQLGLPGLAIPSESGGAGFGPVELGVVCRELGRALLPGPFFATVVLAGQALAASDDREAMERWLPGIADGTLTATLAASERGGDRANPATTATHSGSGIVINGKKSLVVDGDTAQLLIVIARGPDGPGLYAVGADAPGVGRQQVATLDATRRTATVELVDAPAVQVGPPGEQFVGRVLGLATTGLAAEQAGGAAACLDATVGYAKTRFQFGRAIGSFQAIKHKCADLLIETEGAQSAALYAARAAAEDPAELPIAAAVAGTYCAEAYMHAAKENIQVHGGIGFTWEHDAHLHLKRAKTVEHLLGTPAEHRGQIAILAGIDSLLTEKESVRR